MDQTQRKDRGLKLLHQMLGPEQAERTRMLWRQICPDFEEYVLEFLAGEIWSRPNLDLRTRSLTTIAALAALGRSLGLELNIRMALNNAAPRHAIPQTLLHIPPSPPLPPPCH